MMVDMLEIDDDHLKLFISVGAVKELYTLKQCLLCWHFYKKSIKLLVII